MYIPIIIRRSYKHEATISKSPHTFEARTRGDTRICVYYLLLFYLCLCFTRGDTRITIVIKNCNNINQ